MGHRGVLLIIAFFLVVFCSAKSFEGRVKRATLNFCDLDDIFKCETGLCIPAQWRCDGAADCDGGDDEKNCDGASDTTAPPATTTLMPDLSDIKCRAGNFYCASDDICVPRAWRCDAMADCSQGEDEQGCSAAPRTEKTTRPATTTSTLAPTTKTISQATTPTNFKCRIDQFFCSSNIICIPKPWRCDGMADCSQGEDEQNCGSATLKTTTTPALPTTASTAATTKMTSLATSPADSLCRSGQFYCSSNKVCIPKVWECDGMNDCIQGEDEQDCGRDTTTQTKPSTTTKITTTEVATEMTTTRETQCGDGRFQCGRYECIPGAWRCDGTPDCKGGEDEENCRTTEPSTTPSASVTSPSNGGCPAGQFFCRFNKICIPRAWQCDGARDCSQGEDEENCATTPPTIKTTTQQTTKSTASVTSPSNGGCPADQFFCRYNNRCIPIAWQCDGEQDCSQGEDEDNCATTPPTVKTTTQQTTKSTASVTSPSDGGCSAGQFYCRFNKICIPFAWQCDGAQDCSQGEDEENCATTPPTVKTTTQQTTKSTASVTSPSNGGCYDDQFFCRYSNRCIPSAWQCDGARDCSRGEDEEDCAITTQTPSTVKTTTQQMTKSTASVTSPSNGGCSAGQFFCRFNKICIPGAWQCDGARDCSRGEDEDDCAITTSTVKTTTQQTTKSAASVTSPSNTGCSAGQFYCRFNDICIPIAWRCDGGKDCSQGEDEHNCATTEVYTTPETTPVANVTVSTVPMTTELQTTPVANVTVPPVTNATITNTTVCNSQQFMCTSDRKCIPVGWVCDSEPDCAQGEDEKDCDSNKCNNDQFRCRSGNCIPLSWKCDSQADCFHSDDEANCTNRNITCEQDQFKCEVDQKCIDGRWRCDGDSDCSSGSDEQNCPAVTCASDQFLCPTDNKCVPAQWRCDGDSDCSSSEDEVGCGSPEITCPPTQFMCSDQNCIPASWRCDNERDCSQGTDEENCALPSTTNTSYNMTTSLGNTTLPTTESHSSLPANSTIFPTTPSCKGFLCTSTGLCIDAVNRCDGFHDCENSEDEEGCEGTTEIMSTTSRETTVKVPSTTINPNYSYCPRSDLHIPTAWFCDGMKDCKFGEDEENCTRPTPENTTPPQTTRPSTPIQCGPDYYYCEPTQCIPRSQLCDGVTQCANGADESPSQCPTTTPRPSTRLSTRSSTETTTEATTEVTSSMPVCSDSEFSCGDGKCIPGVWRCDGVPECRNRRDEENCPTAPATPTTTRRPTVPTCPPNKFNCGDGICLPLYWYCDGQVDCPSGADESDCSEPPAPTSSTTPPTSPPTSPPTTPPTSPPTSPRNLCPPDKFDCGDGTCLPPHWRCDNRVDCSSGADEAGCSASTPPPKCRSDQFDCGDGTCLPARWRCDNQVDCPTRADEENCSDDTNSSSDDSDENDDFWWLPRGWPFGTGK